MADLDPTRATFVQQEFRYTTNKDNIVKATYPDARSLTIDTSLDEASAVTMASKWQAEYGVQKRHLELSYAGPLLPSQLSGAMVAFTLAPGTVAKLVSFSDDPMRGVVSVVVRGS